MESKVEFYNRPYKTEIIISPAPSGVIIMGTWIFYVLPWLIIASFWFYIGSLETYVELMIVPLLLIAFSLFFGLKFLRRLYEQEVIEVYRETITLYKQFLFTSGKRDFQRSSILDLKYAGSENFTLSIDLEFVGKGMANKDIEWLSSNGNLSFFYKGSIIRFGKNVYEEDAQRILKAMYLPLENNN